MDTENVVHFTMEYNSTIKNNDFMKFAAKWVEHENIILSEVTHSKENTWYVLTNKWLLTQRLTMHMIQPTDHMKCRGRKIRG